MKQTLLALIATISFVASAHSQTVGIQPVAVTTTSELAGYEATETIDSTAYTSGVTDWATIQGLPYDTTNHHTQSAATSGQITWDLGGTFTIDRARIDWTNNGTLNNFSDFTLSVSTDSSFSSSTLVYTNTGDPSSQFEIINFSTAATGQFVRLEWTSIQNSFGGMREFILGGMPASLAEEEEEAFPVPVLSTGWLVALALCLLVLARREPA